MSRPFFDRFLEFRGVFNLFRSAGKGKLGDIVAAVEPRKLAQAAFLIKRQNVGIGSARSALLSLLHNDYPPCRDLREMRHAHDLLAERDLKQLFADTLRGNAGNSRYRSRQNHGLNRIVLREHIFHRQHYAAQLTAGGRCG